MGAAEALVGRIREVRVFPDPVLKERAQEVVAFDQGLSGLLGDLVATMHSLPRCVGLAAPQIGVGLRVVVVDVSLHPKAPSVNHGLLLMVNPRVVSAAGERVSREGCVSVPDFTADVLRAERVAIDYQDAHGKLHAIEAGGFEAIALQHEIDHLDGKLFLDRVSPEQVFHRRRRK